MSKSFTKIVSQCLIAIDKYLKVLVHYTTFDVAIQNCATIPKFKLNQET